MIGINDILIVMIPSTILLVIFFPEFFWVEGKIRDIFYGAKDPSMPISTTCNANPKKLKRSVTIWIWKCQKTTESKLYTILCYLQLTTSTNSTHITLHLIFNCSHSWLCSFSEIVNPYQIIPLIIENLYSYVSLILFSIMWNTTVLFNYNHSLDPYMIPFIQIYSWKLI